MQYIVKRNRPRTYYKADAQKERRISEGRVKRCGVCTLEVPASDITEEPGVNGAVGAAIEKCPMCVDTMSAEWRQKEQEDVAQEIEESTERAYLPQISYRPLNEPQPTIINSITDSAGNWLSQSQPLSLTRGGTAVTVLINGRRFASTDTISYPTGISDNSAPIRTNTLTTLSLVASGAMSAGSYSLTFNGHVYVNIFSVR
jgi:hypothetical protein